MGKSGGNGSGRKEENKGGRMWPEGGQGKTVQLRQGCTWTATDGRDRTGRNRTGRRTGDYLSMKHGIVFRARGDGKRYDAPPPHSKFILFMAR
jgi:hypothetical protein